MYGIPPLHVHPIFRPVNRLEKRRLDHEQIIKLLIYNSNSGNSILGAETSDTLRGSSNTFLRNSLVMISNYH